jgi:hypothetical protein
VKEYSSGAKEAPIPSTSFLRWSRSDSTSESNGVGFLFFLVFVIFDLSFSG